MVLGFETQVCTQACSTSFLGVSAGVLYAKQNVLSPSVSNSFKHTSLASLLSTVIQLLSGSECLVGVS